MIIRRTKLEEKELSYEKGQKRRPMKKKCLVGQLVKVYNIVFVRNGLKVDLLRQDDFSFKLSFAPILYSLLWAR